MAEVTKADLREVRDDIREYLAERFALTDQVSGERLDAIKAAIAELRTRFDKLEEQTRELHEFRRRTDERLRSLETASGQVPRSRKGDVDRDWKTISYGVGLIGLGIYFIVDMIFKAGDLLKAYGLR
jgi:chromosome segregation ATPase